MTGRSAGPKGIYPTVRRTIPPTVIKAPRAVFQVKRFPPESQTHQGRPKRGEVKAIGITRPRGAPLRAA